MSATQVLTSPSGQARRIHERNDPRLGGPRVEHDRRVREAEGGFCAPVCKENVGAEQRFHGEKEDFRAGSQMSNADRDGKPW